VPQLAAQAAHAEACYSFIKRGHNRPGIEILRVEILVAHSKTLGDALTDHRIVMLPKILLYEVSVLQPPAIIDRQ